MKHYISTTLASTIASRTKVLIFAAAAAGAIGIFVVPWFVPLRLPVASLSYTYGFNNFVAWLAVAALLGLLSLILLLRRSILGPSSLERKLSEILPDGGTSRNSRGLFATFVAVAVIGAAIQIVWYAILPSNHYGEIKQHISRLDLMTFGQRPHLDFEYSFGPGMLYPAYSLVRLGAGALSVDTAYCITLSAYWILGTYLAYYVIKNLNGTVKRITVFLGISLLFFHPSAMGLQYSPMRYFIPLASLLFIHRSLSAATPARLVWHHTWTAALAFVLPLIALAFSPEAGIATTLAVAAYFLALIRSPQRMFSWCVLGPALAVVTANFSFNPGYLHAARSYSSSASCSPVFPTPSVCTLLFAACLILPNLAIIGLKARTPTGSLAIAFTVLLGLGIPPALGRCDLVHISLNGIGILMFALALVTSWPMKRLYYPLLYAYVLLFPSGLLAGMLWLGYGPMSLNALKRRISDARVSHRDLLADQKELQERNHRLYGKPRYFPPDLLELLRYPKVGTPLGTTEDIERFLRVSDRWVPEYWPASGSTVNVWAPADVARKLSDLSAMDVILVPKNVYLVDNFLTIPVNSDLTLQGGLDPVVQRKTAVRILSTINMFPVWLPKPRSQPFYPEVQIMETIAKEYVPVGHFRYFTIARKRSDSVNPP